MNKLELLQQIDDLESQGYVIFLKWDGERKKGKKTIIISKPETDLFIRRDSDDLWSSLADAIEELELIHHKKHIP